MAVRYRAAPPAGLQLAGLQLTGPTPVPALPAELLPAGELPAEIELACDVIDRLELHRRCLDEALADAYAAAVLADHPSIYYKLDESAGTTATDSSGHRLDGTYNGVSDTRILAYVTCIDCGATCDPSKREAGADRRALPRSNSDGAVAAIDWALAHENPVLRSASA